MEEQADHSQQSDDVSTTSRSSYSGIDGFSRRLQSANAAAAAATIANSPQRNLPPTNSNDDGMHARTVSSAYPSPVDGRVFFNETGQISSYVALDIASLDLQQTVFHFWCALLFMCGLRCVCEGLRP